MKPYNTGTHSLYLISHSLSTRPTQSPKPAHLLLLPPDKLPQPTPKRPQRTILLIAGNPTCDAKAAAKLVIMTSRPLHPRKGCDTFVSAPGLTTLR